MQRPDQLVQGRDRGVKPTVTWKRNGSVIVVGDHSSAVKRFIFVKKVQVLQGCLCIPMASLTSQ